MTDPEQAKKDEPAEDPTPFHLFGAPTNQSRLERRRRKIADEIARNRRGEYKIPTWVLVVCLVVFVAAWAGWVIFAG
jgi:hypothetical protein